MKKEISFLAILGLVSLLFSISCRKESIQSQKPVAVAGGDIIVQLPHEKIILNGTSSFDPDGEILEYNWSKISGLDFITVSNKTSPQATLEFLSAGDYQIQLEVTDNSGISSYDTVAISILKYPTGYEIVLDGLHFNFDRFENELFLRTNPRPDIFFNYPVPAGIYLNAEVLFKLETSPSWTILKHFSEFNQAASEQYLYRISEEFMYVFRVPADPLFDGKAAMVKLKFN